MKKQTIIHSVIAILLCIAVLLPGIVIPAQAAALPNFQVGSDYAGVKFSVIGDSISTYYGYSNSKTYNPLYLSTSEATFGTYYGNKSHGDYGDFDHIAWTDTWWKQTVDTLGMDLLVNNAWSGSFLLSDAGQSNTTEYPAAAYKTRAVNMHYGSTKPDIIAAYLGTNDVAYYSDRPVGTKANVDTSSERKALYTSVNNYKTPSTAVEAYYIMLSRMVDTYPDAEIYCMTPSICLNAMSSGRYNALIALNDGIAYLVDYFQSQGKKVYLVDLNNDAGLVDYDTVRSYYYCNNVHPDKAGMDWITACLVSEIMEHSTKGKGNAVTHRVSYDLDQVFVKEGMIRYGVEGESFRLTMLPYEDYQNVKLKVTMTDAATGAEVEIPGLGTSGNEVFIPEVKGPISITAEAVNERNYFWNADNDALVSVCDYEFAYNGAELKNGTYGGGVMSETYYALEKTVVLRHDQPWVLEFKGGGGTYAGGIMLFSGNTDGSVSGNTYIHINQSNVFFGYRNSNGYNNSGISWADIASKMGSSAGADYRTEIHTFRFVNEISGSKNMIRLYVDGVDVGTMDASKMIGTNSSHSAVSSINLSGVDFVFPYMGASNFTLNNCSVEYIKIWENGDSVERPESFDTYRWELNAAGNAFISVDDDDIYTENKLTMLTGSISGGIFSGTTFAMDKGVVLLHDQPWRITWESDGTWEDARGGGMLLATTLNYKGPHAAYLYRRPGSDFITIGEWSEGVHNNYGLTLSEFGIDGSAHHKYELVNDISGTTNMVYLYVDDVKIGALTDHYEATTLTETNSQWCSGRDFVFSYIGTTEFPVGGCSIDYLEIKVQCPHRYSDWKTDVSATCLNDGSKSRSCSLCGDVQTEAIPAEGHNYGVVAIPGNCQSHEGNRYTCSVCGHTYDAYAEHLYSDWFEGKPDGVAEKLIQTKIQYRYADRISTTSEDAVLPGYELIGSEWATTGTKGSVEYVGSWPGGFSTSNSLYTKYNLSKQASTDSVKIVTDSDSVTGYLYYHWCYSGSTYSVESKSGSYTTFHAYYSTSDPSNYTCDTSDMSYKTCHSTCSNSNWWFVTEVRTQSYTAYNKVYTHAKWGEWSAWGDDAVEASDDRKVEQRTVYRYVNAPYGDHSWVDGVCNVCGAIDPNYQPAKLSGTGFSLSFEDEILVNFYFGAEKVEDAQIGMLVFYSDPGHVDYDLADEVYPNATNLSSGRYMAQTAGIPAKCMGDIRYYAAYARLSDGTYVFSPIYEYSPKKYAMNMLRSSTSSDNQKALCVAMLNYGAEAQKYFNYNTESLMNAELTAAQQAMVVDYSASLFTGPVAVDPSKIGTMAKTETGFSTRSATVSFDGAFAINYYLAPDSYIDSSITFYYWSSSAYAAVTELSASNATGKLTMQKQPDGSYWAQISGIAAKELDDTYYVAAVYTSDLDRCCTGVIAYSLSKYCMNNAANGSDMQEFAKATAVYGHHARVYFDALKG